MSFDIATVITYPKIWDNIDMVKKFLKILRYVFLFPIIIHTEIYCLKEFIQNTAIAIWEIKIIAIVIRKIFIVKLLYCTKSENEILSGIISEIFAP